MTEREVEAVARAICRKMFTKEDHGDDRCCQIGGTAGCCASSLRKEARAAIAGAEGARG